MRVEGWAQVRFIYMCVYSVCSYFKERKIVMNGIIYYAISPSGKGYVGQTTQLLRQRIATHKNFAEKERDNFVFHKAIRKYGFDNFTWEILEENIQTIEELNEREQYWIKEKRTYPDGYNMTPGGDNYEHLFLFNEGALLQLVEEYKQCGNSYLLAQKYNTTSSVIIRNIKRVEPNWQQYSYNGQGGKSIFNDEQKQEIYGYFKQVGSVQKVIDKFGSSGNTIRRILKSIDENYLQYQQKACWGAHTRGLK